MATILGQTTRCKFQILLEIEKMLEKWPRCAGISEKKAAYKMHLVFAESIRITTAYKQKLWKSSRYHRAQHMLGTDFGAFLRRLPLLQKWNCLFSSLLVHGAVTLGTHHGSHQRLPPATWHRLGHVSGSLFPFHIILSLVHWLLCGCILVYYFQMVKRYKIFCFWNFPCNEIELVL